MSVCISFLCVLHLVSLMQIRALTRGGGEGPAAIKLLSEVTVTMPQLLELLKVCVHLHECEWECRWATVAVHTRIYLRRIQACMRLNSLRKRHCDP